VCSIFNKLNLENDTRFWSLFGHGLMGIGDNLRKAQLVLETLWEMLAE
jgi:hypothetical protein